MSRIRELLQTSKERLKHGPNRQIVFATDVPFWRRRTGAQLRIAELIDILKSHSFDVFVCYLGSWQAGSADPSNPGDLLISDLQWISQLGLQAVSLYDDWVPTNLVEQLVWQAKCGLHSALRKIQGVLPDNRNQNQKSGFPLNPKRLADFYSSTLEHRFRWLIRELRSRTVIVEYISLGYLVPEPPLREGVFYWIDTHDRLAVRARQFAENGFQHWLQVTTEEENEAIDRFDGVIAIQPAERDYFQKIVTRGQPVVTAGYSGMTTKPASRETAHHDKSHCSIGMLGSNNNANLHAVEWFLREVWPLVLADTNKAELIIGGTICHAVKDRILPGQCRLLGVVDSLEAFYSKTDLIVNPIKFGTGLKIKTIEALRFARPLIASSHAVEGLKHFLNSAAEERLPWLVADSAADMAKEIVRLAAAPQERRIMSERADSFVRTELAQENVYCDLIEELEAIHAK